MLIRTTHSRPSHYYRQLRRLLVTSSIHAYDNQNDHYNIRRSYNTNRHDINRSTIVSTTTVSFVTQSRRRQQQKQLNYYCAYIKPIRRCFLSTSPKRDSHRRNVLPSRNINSRYDALNYYSYNNDDDNYDHSYSNNNNFNAISSYRSYPLSFGGIQLLPALAPTSTSSLFNSALSHDNVWEEDVDDVNNNSDNNDEYNERPHPPTLMDETSYGDYGDYDQYYEKPPSNRTNDNILLYEQQQPQPVKKPFVPIQSTTKNKAATATTTNARQPKAQSPVSTATYDTNKSQQEILRPPVKVSIPSSGMNRNSKQTKNLSTNAFMDVDLSMYDTTFDTDENKDNLDSNRIVETPIRKSNEIHKEEQQQRSTLNNTSSLSSPPSSLSLIPSTHFHAGQTLTDIPGYDPTMDEFLSKAAYGLGATSSIDLLQEELQSTEKAIYQQNQNIIFNINSPKQVAIVLFGTDTNVSTNKDVLEIMAGNGNELAKLILQYRNLKYKITKFVRQDTNQKKGIAVRSALTVARPKSKEAIVSKDESDDTSTVVKNAPPTVVEKKDQQESSSQYLLKDIAADPLLLLDASAYIFRAYYSMPPVHRSDGMPIGAVMGFCKMLNSLILHRMLDGEQPRLVLCFDAKGKTFRHDVFDQYKANRPPAPMDLVPQFELVRQAAKAYGICQIEAIHFEADDVIATLACKAIEEGVDANIMSGDKDLMQLVTDDNATPSIQIIDPMKKERTTYQQVVEKWSVPPNKLGDVLALAGDTADNVPGVRGIGPKTAAKLINDYGSLDNVLNSIESIKQQGIRDKLREDKSNAILSRTLVELNRTVPMDELIGLPNGTQQKISDLRMESIDPDRIIAFYDQMGFKELKRSFLKKIQGLQVTRKKPSSYKKRPKATIPIPDDYKDVPF